MAIYQEYKAGTLDLISSDYTRPEENASEIQNVLFTGSVTDPAIEKRFGLKRRSKVGPVFGAVSFRNLINPRPDGKKELVGFFEDGVRRRVDSKITIAYTGVATQASVWCGFDFGTDQIRFRITVGGVQILDMALGLGYDEVTPITMATLQATIDSLPDITATLSGTGSVPAAFTDNFYEADLLTDDLLVTAHEWQEITKLAFKTGGIKFGFLWAQLAWIDQVDEYEHVQTTELNNVLYFVFSGELWKYDGQTAWRAGQDNPVVTLAQGVAGALPAGTFNYIIRTRQVDRAGNIVLGPWEYKSITVAASKGVNVTIVPSIQGLYSNRFVCGSTMGSPSDIISYSSNTLLVGDVVTVWDNETMALVDTFVVAIDTGASTIQLGTAVKMKNNESGSNGLSWEIGRQKQGGVIYYRIAERPYRFDFPSSAEWFDEELDAALTEELVEPEFDFGPPPACRYVATYNSGLVVAGSPLSFIRRWEVENGGSPVDGDLQNGVNFADYEFPEGWPKDGSYQVKVDTKTGDGIRGIREVGSSLIVLKDQSTARLSGDPTELEIKVDWLSKEVGCLAGHTIKEVNGQLFFLSTRGFASVNEASSPSEKMGFVIRPIINQENLAFSKKLRFLAGHTALLSDRQLYICYFPAYPKKSLWKTDIAYGFNNGEGGALPVTFSHPYDAGDGRTFAYDYLRDRWTEWKFNALGSMAELEGLLTISEGRLSPQSNTVENGHFQENIGNYGIMYEDHNIPILFIEGTAWYTAGKPKVDKHVPRISISSVPSTVDNEPTLDIRQQVNFLREDQVMVQVELFDQADPFQVVAQEQLLDGKFKSTRFLFQNEQHNRNVQIEGWQVEVDAPYVSELKK